MTGSNRRHPACKAGALPAELIARNGDPGRIRTCGLLIRSQTLYPAGLRSQLFLCPINIIPFIIYYVNIFHRKIRPHLIGQRPSLT